MGNRMKTQHQAIVNEAYEDIEFHTFPSSKQKCLKVTQISFPTPYRNRSI